MDALRRAGLVDGFRMILRETSEWDDERKHAACEDLLRRARATWEDMLVDELIETDPEPVRQAILCANTMCELRHLATRSGSRPPCCGRPRRSMIRRHSPT